MIKVLHTESSEGWGGQELRSAQEVRLLSERDDFEVQLFVSKNSQYEDRAKVIRPFLITGPIGKKSVRAILAMRKRIRIFRPDIVSCHSSIDSWLVAIAQVMVRHRFKIVRFRHVRAAVKSSLPTRWLYSQASLVITTSEDIKKHIQESLPLKIPVISIPTGVDLHYFNLSEDPVFEKNLLKNQNSIPKNSFVILMVSTLRSWKGHSYVIDALDRLPECFLIVVGDGPQENNLKYQVAARGLTDRVFFAGYKEDVVDFYKMADLFLQPSYANEGVSQSLYQACAMEMCVIASDIGGLNEVILHGVNGLLVEPKSSKSIIEAVLEVMSSGPERRKRLGTQARATVVANGSIDQMVTKTESCYQNLLK